jgi:hypothetical protein
MNCFSMTACPLYTLVCISNLPVLVIIYSRPHENALFEKAHKHLGSGLDWTGLKHTYTYTLLIWKFES